MILSANVVNAKSFMLLNFILPATVLASLFLVFGSVVCIIIFLRNVYSPDMTELYTSVTAFEKLPDGEKTKERFLKMIS
jgi:hypothetical protein